MEDIIGSCKSTSSYVACLLATYIDIGAIDYSCYAGRKIDLSFLV